MIDLALERKAFGLRATPQGRAALYRKYGEALFEQRREIWGASPGTIRSGREPGTEGHSVEVIAEVEVVAAADEDSQSPYNPLKRYLSAESRAAECVKYLNRFGTAAVRAQCAKYSVDIAGRPLAKRA